MTAHTLTETTEFVKYLSEVYAAKAKLLARPLCAQVTTRARELQLANVSPQASVEASAEELKTSSIYSSKDYTIPTFDYDETTRESVKKFVSAKLRITVAKAGKKFTDYYYEANGVMAHEFKIERVDAKGDSINSEGETYYAKACGKKGSFAFLIAIQSLVVRTTIL